MTRLSLTINYGLFAALAVAANLLSQELTMQVYDGAWALYVAIAIGTVVGLVSKYEMDKRYIFRHGHMETQRDLQRFMAYSLTGVITTFLFWGFELAFEFWIGSRLARYTGAVIGLTLGYALKYQLDKRYVFVQDQ